MGLFFDEDVNDAEALIKKSLKEEPARKRKLELEFIKGFESGLKRGRAFAELRPDELERMFKNPKDLKNFGFALGHLTAMLKNKIYLDGHPILLFPKDYIRVINILKGIDYYEFLVKKIKIFARLQKSRIGEMSEHEREGFAYFIRHV